MAHTRSNKVARTSSTANPITQSVTLTNNDTVVVVLINVVGNVVRAGGTPSFGGIPMRQASTQQIAATTPEASAEIWYLDQRDGLPWPPGSYTLSIPNTGTLSTRYTVEAGQAAGGGRSALEAANGANATGTNPSPGAITITQAGDIAWSIIAGGAQTWSPSAQAGTIIANTDDGSTGGGEQYILNPSIGSLTLNWTFNTSEDYGAVVVAFKEVPPRSFNNYIRVQAGNGISVAGVG